MPTHGKGTFVRKHYPSYWSILGDKLGVQLKKKTAIDNGHVPNGVFGQPHPSAHNQPPMPLHHSAGSASTPHMPWNRKASLSSARGHNEAPSRRSMTSSFHSPPPSLRHRDRSPPLHSHRSRAQSFADVGRAPRTQVPHGNGGGGRRVDPEELRTHMEHGGETRRGEHVRGFKGRTKYPGSVRSARHGREEGGRDRGEGGRGGDEGGGNGVPWEVGETEWVDARTRGR
ncbi:hypothetical protein K458DRAFT_470107 [Lentithecium fluviatile CBS 122367]|uniref:Uncharacterized protein n=1 Tax=Lentithecium fluviatile CBS 122367 TaxID=1168545 RepID=A0A6G1ICF5_9PLEO|nr:hypothetical protein K458DRAFT_470107 [Lentithecium fluviatile CBS 122367]